MGPGTVRLELGVDTVDTIAAKEGGSGLLACSSLTQLNKGTTTRRLNLSLRVVRSAYLKPQILVGATLQRRAYQNLGFRYSDRH